MLVLSRDQGRRVDQLAHERYKIPGIILMENAGANAAAIIHRAYASAGTAFIICGTGNNGGDGCVIARHLHNLGWKARVLVLGDESRMSPDMRANFDIVRAMGLVLGESPTQFIRRGGVGADVPPLHVSSTLSRLADIAPGDIVIDAILGTGFRGQLRDDLAANIEAINAARKRATAAIDIPSGLDCDTGQPGGAAIRADLTITFVAAKPGLLTPHAAPFVGRLEVADIGAPRELIEQIAAGD
jgi:NAD(P)H-hydrate epimerase